MLSKKKLTLENDTIRDTLSNTHDSNIPRTVSRSSNRSWNVSKTNAYMKSLRGSFKLGIGKDGVNSQGYVMVKEMVTVMKPPHRYSTFRGYFRNYYGLCERRKLVPLWRTWMREKFELGVA